MLLHGLSDVSYRQSCSNHAPKCGFITRKKGLQHIAAKLVYLRHIKNAEYISEVLKLYR